MKIYIILLFTVCCHAGHEAHLQLKETEYVQGLDVVYIVSAFHIFSSFKLRSAHYRGAMHILKFIGIIIYATMFFYTYYQVSIQLYVAQISQLDIQFSYIFVSVIGFGLDMPHVCLPTGLCHTAALQWRSSMYCCVSVYVVWFWICWLVLCDLPLMSTGNSLNTRL